MDWVVANQVGQSGAGFAADTNEVLLIGADGSFKKIGPANKSAIAIELVEMLAKSRV
jgi:phosphopantothenoylcysteine synthetase/decarboxylase